MSKVLSDWTKETIVETRKTKELEGIKCDNCGKVIPTVPFPETPKIYYRVRRNEQVSNSDRETTKDYADICPECLCSFAIDFFKNRTFATSVYIEKEKAVKIDVQSDKNGNFKK